MVARHEARSFPEIPENGSRLGERTAVVEHKRGYPKGGVEASEKLWPAGAVDDVDGATLERNPEVREQQPHLVTVARNRTVVEDHHPTLTVR
jgi:hypothetical protein